VSFGQKERFFEKKISRLFPLLFLKKLKKIKGGE
jgi:hypothetical protein